jgi:transposase InsO family protein
MLPRAVRFGANDVAPGPNELNGPVSASASEVYRQYLADHRLVGSMSRRGNPYDNAKAESFMKTLKVEAVYLMAYETFEDVTADLPASSTRSTTRAGFTPRSDI